MSQSFLNAKDFLTETAVKAANSVTQVTESAKTSLSETADKAFDAISETASSAGSTASQVTSQALETLAETAEKAKSSLSSAASQAITSVSETTSQAVGAVAKTAEKAKDAISQTTNSAGSAVSQVTSQTVETVAETAEQAKNSLSSAAGQAVTSVRETTFKVVGALAETAEKAKDTISQTTNYAVTTVNQVTNQAAVTVSEVTEKAKTSLEDTIQQAEDLNHSFSETVRSAISFSLKDWTDSHTLVLWGISHPILSLAIILVASFIIVGFFQAFSSLFEEAWLFILKSPGKLVRGALSFGSKSVRDGGKVAANKRFSVKPVERDNYNWDMSGVKSLSLNSQERLSKIFTRLEEIKQEESQLLQEVSALLKAGK
ncbi:hypothetical protein [Kamptonema formosum]|uniref:hypothetical protein n=1 Tax=Kamptonema formosum TaxID=331992 RepID=UPI00037F4374|nr:hypothetical protein [Oscillatoria sp. PCC 10802]